MTIAPNINLGHYKIISLLGAGGMGEVYLAKDTQLERLVALKILPANFSQVDESVRRFVQEAKAASALNHPNILTIHEIGNADGLRFIAAEYVKGETLRERLRREPLNLRETLDIAVQIASALNAAHSNGIIHRDLKPENIMLREDGLVKILDFGLAKLGEQKPESVVSEDETRALVQTTPGMILGTVAYMSPEQARGKETDARTDIWSLGVVLYEMLTRQLPFVGETTSDVIAALLKTEPAPLGENAPPELIRIVRKALQKNADERYQTVKDLLLDLKSLKRELEIAEEIERSQIPSAKAANVGAASQSENLTVSQSAAISTQDSAPHQVSSAEYLIGEVKQHKFVSLAALLILLLAIGGIGYWYFDSHSANTKQIESIAVLPFQNESGNADNEYLSDGMTESLIGSISQIPNLSVKARSSVFRYKGKETDLPKIAQALNVQAILTGRVAQRGEQLLLSLELVDAKTENVVWSEQYNRKQSDLVSLQSEIARDVSNKLRMKLSGAEQNRIAKNYTENTEAYQLYLKGRYYWNKRTAANIRKSIEYFQQAIDRDPTFALAYAALADSYQLLAERDVNLPRAEMYQKARAAVNTALEMDGNLAEAHADLGLLNSRGWKFADAEKEFRTAIQLNPNYATAHQWYALFLSGMGRHDEAIAEVKKAQELDPLSLIINVDVGNVYFYARQYDQAIEQLRKTIEMDQNFAPAHRFLGYAYEMERMFEECAAEYEKMEILDGTPPEQAAKRWAEARAAYKISGWKGVYQKVIEIALRDRPYYASQYFVATLYAQTGEKDKAFEYLERAYQAHDGALRDLKIEPRLDPLRDDPRFQDLVRRVGLQ